MSSSEFDPNEDLSEAESQSVEGDSENDINNDDDDDADDLTNDIDITTADDVDDIEDHYNIEDTEHFQDLYDSCQNTETSDLSQFHPIEQFVLDHVRPAMNSACHSTSKPNTSLPIFGDSLDAYLFSAPLIQRGMPAHSCYFSYIPVTSASRSKLFIGNVPHGTTWEQLKEYFTRSGYRVQHVYIPVKPVCILT